MSTTQEQAGGYEDFDGEAEGAKARAEGGSAIPDGAHVFQVKGLRRKTTGAGDVAVSMDLMVVVSKSNPTTITREFQGTEIELFYFLSKSDPKTRKMNLDRMMEDLTKLVGGPPAGKFSVNFEDWAKQVIGLNFVATQKTSTTKDKKGKFFVNYYLDKLYTLTDDDRAALGASGAKPGEHIPF